MQRILLLCLAIVGWTPFSEADVFPLDGNDFQEIVTSTAPALIRFDPVDCAECHQLDPFWETTGQIFPFVYRLDCTDNPDVCSAVGIHSGNSPQFAAWVLNEKEWKLQPYTGPPSLDAVAQWIQTVVESIPKSDTEQTPVEDVDENLLSVEERMQMGWMLMMKGEATQMRGVEMLERVQPLMDPDHPATLIISATLGRFEAHRNEYRYARRSTEAAFEISKRTTPGGDVCLQMQLASMMHYFPESMEEADKSLEDMMAQAKSLLSRSDIVIDEDTLSDQMPGAGADPYNHCLLSLFYLSFFYRADTAAVAALHYEMAIRGFPELEYTAPHVQHFPENPPCVNRKIRLAVMAGTLSEGHSVSEDFGGVLSRLDRNIFDVTYIYIYESGSPIIDSFTKMHEQDRVLIWKQLPSEQRRASWVVRYGRQAAEFEFDMVLFLDLTMSLHTRRVGMQRLAPVQLNTHGHPVTSGHPRSIIQYFVSWAEAEIPTAQEHYTEELVLIPKGKIHQYYRPRTLPGNISRMDGQAFGNLGRSDFGIPESVSVYLCMQKPFKVHPEFDELVCGVLQKDPQGYAVLHKETVNQDTYEKRLQKAGCDMDRVLFMDAQPHHRLLALYRLSTVVLDSYPAGGCTTTREVLEVGKPLVTLPARLLGGRWTLGYYNVIDLAQEAKDALVASSTAEYIDMAVALGTNKTKREIVENHVAEALPSMFYRMEAVEEWQRILLQVSPVKRCTATSGDEL